MQKTLHNRYFSYVAREILCRAPGKFNELLALPKFIIENDEILPPMEMCIGVHLPELFLPFPKICILSLSSNPSKT